MPMKKLIFVLAFGLVMCQSKPIDKLPSPTAPAIVAPAVETAQVSKKPKNIIFLIGDGMGLGQITGGMYMNNNKLNLERFKKIGLIKTHASDKLITDSAASATAYSCGIKTYNGAIGVDQNKKPVKTILEYAEDAGFATGLVATSTICHATPASYIAHNENRRNYEAIALDFLNTEVDLFIGGGLKSFKNRTSDQRNLYDELVAKGYHVGNYAETEISSLQNITEPNIAYFTALDQPLPQSQGRDYLLPASEKAWSFLDKRSDKGFFLMIEGSQIDWGGHANNTDYIISEMLEFDKVIGKALDFTIANGETLLVITADHETGGFAIQRESTMNNIVGAFTSDYHTATMIPVFAYGPGAEEFTGIYDNTAIFTKMMEQLNLKK